MNAPLEPNNLKSEWSEPLNSEDIETTPMTLTVSPDDAAKEAIAKRLGIEGLDRLDTELTIFRDPSNMVINIHGKISARVTQGCVVTLEPVSDDIVAEFDAWYADPSEAVSFAKAKRERELQKQNVEQPMLDEWEDPEPVVDGKIDLGELIVQHLSLNLNPYPRKKDAEYAYSDENEKKATKEGDAYQNPFAKLKDWKEKETKS